MNLNADSPYALKHRDEIDRRREMLTLPHIAPLASYAQNISRAMGTGYEIPHFDPCDGGVRAEALFLLEAPGRKAMGSGFVSRNNPDPTAKTICTLLAEAHTSFRGMSVAGQRFERSQGQTFKRRYHS